MYEEAAASLEAATARLLARRDGTESLELGTAVRFKRPLRRVLSSSDTGSYDRKVWGANPYRHGAYTGIVIGLRTLSDGAVAYHSDVIVYTPSRHYRAVLIAESLYRRPVLVLPGDVEVIR